MSSNTIDSWNLADDSTDYIDVDDFVANYSDDDKYEDDYEHTHDSE